MPKADESSDRVIEINILAINTSWQHCPPFDNANINKQARF
jgi:hypothetical protein